ncbi:MAG: HD domain-containing protein [Candidatus Nealsonbacteria bacterium DGGOD1a]|jgi:Predicted hydrolases of HD superfamily|nr:MAG: HD domain-containing protein [Candidatus Nealsonbacteria bacterium DGGOD1a]
MENIKKLVNFLFELSGAKTMPRSGWQRIGVRLPESLADHSALTGQIAYILAAMEGADADRAAALAIFHDTAKLRLGDINWVARIYNGSASQVERAQKDQIGGVSVAPQMKSIFDELKECKTKEAQIAGDADFLDMAIQAKYYADNGNKKALLWIESAADIFKTDSAKEIFTAVKETGIEDWWMELEPIKNKFESRSKK